MQLDQECVRAILFCLEETLSLDKRGKPVPIQQRELIPLLPQYPPEQVYLSAQYLGEKAFIDRDAPNGQAPKLYKIYSITANGYDYLNAVRSDTVWAKLKELVKDFTKVSAPILLEQALKIRLSLLP